MKIAILTLPLHTNYGGILQCYALQVVLQRMGHTVSVLDTPLYKRRYYFLWVMAICKRLFKRIFLMKKNSILYSQFQIKNTIHRKNTDVFIKKYINRYIDRNWSISLSKKFDAFVVGSDQVWRPLYASDIKKFFLVFLESVKTKRISYAASFGIDTCEEYSKEQLIECKRLIKLFDAVSVREDSGVQICKKYFGIDAKQMLDPTLLLTVDDYRGLIGKSDTYRSLGKLLVYVLDNTEEKVHIVEQLVGSIKTNVYFLDSPDEKDSDLTKIKPKMSVEQWLCSFDDTEMVFTDSFHGCVFSIIFRKPFIVIGNKKRGNARITSLLRLFNLENRMVNSLDEFIKNKSELLAQFDYNPVYEKLETYRNVSFDFLNNALKK